MKEIKLNKGFITQVDDEDFDYLNQWRWHYNKFSVKRTIRLGKTFKCIIMSRLLLNVNDSSLMIDHIDGNPLNNSKINLRICSHNDNIKNLSKHKDNTSGYKGVTKRRNKWRARICVNRKHISLGCFLTKEEAARAYNEAAIIYFGEFARLNEI